MNKIIVEKPKSKFGIYAWINKSDKMVYLGETCDLQRRLCEHIRSMYHMEESSNKNLVNAFNKSETSFIGRIVHYASIYDKNIDGSEKEWLIDETIYMYAFVQRDYKLYNGENEITYDKEGKISNYPNELKDNEGNERSFLRRDPEKMRENLYNYCKKRCKNYSEENIKKKIALALDIIDNIVKEIEKIDTTSNNYYFIKEEHEVNSVCNKISRVFLQKNDVEKLDIYPTSKENLLSMIDNNDFNRIAVCGFGNYLDQSSLTILRTKQYDIKFNTLCVTDGDIKDIDIVKRKKENKKGICLWAYGKSNLDEYRKYLSYGGEDKSPRYLILPYVQSDLYATSKNGKEKIKENKQNFNLKDGEAIDTFFNRMREIYSKQSEEVYKRILVYNQELKSAQKLDNPLAKSEAKKNLLNDRLEIDNFAFGYAWDERNAVNKTGDKKDYPPHMFPEIIQKVSCNSENGNLRNHNSGAFLISEFGYIDVSIEKNEDLDEFYSCFTSHTNIGLDVTLKYSNNVACAELTDKTGLKNYLEKCNNNNNDIRLFFAKIEYPYCVALVNDPVKPKG